MSQRIYLNINKEITQFTHREAVWHSFLSHFVGNPHSSGFLFCRPQTGMLTTPPHGKQLVVLTSFRGVCVCLDESIQREVTGIYNKKWWNSSRCLCNGYDRGRKVSNTSLQSFGRKRLFFPHFSVSVFLSLSPSLMLRLSTFILRS